MSPEITDHGGPRAPESPETDLQSNVDPVKQVTDTNNRSPTIRGKESDADLTSTEATLDLREICESNGFEGNSNPDNEPTLSQEIPKQAPTGDEDEDSPLDDVPPEGNAGDSEDDDFPVFEGGFPRGRIVSTVVGRPPPKPKPRPK